MSRGLCLRSAIAAAVVLSIALPSQGQTVAVALQFRMSVGDVMYHAETESSQLTIDLGSSRSRTDVRSVGRGAVRALETAALGETIVEYVVEESRVTADGRTTEEPDQPWTLRVSPNGRVTDRVIAPQALEDFPVALPERPVRQGETWTRKTGGTLNGWATEGNGTFTLVSIASSADGRIGKVRYSTDGIATLTPRVEEGTRIQGRGTAKTTGEYDWLVERGRPGVMNMEMNLDASVDATRGGVTRRFRLYGRITERKEPLAGDRVLPQMPTSEFAALPGQSIGPFAIATTVDDLTRRLGTSESREQGLGYNSSSRRWANGLVAYVDRDDNDKILGLEIDDRRYRTPKGVGGGASLGAAVVAHGPASQRVEMKLPAGPVQILIYNDQGLAVAVSADAGEAVRVPYGIVRWVTVFAPGNAARIFPLLERRP